MVGVGSGEDGGSGARRRPPRGAARKTRLASPFLETRSSFASLIPAGKATARTAMPAASSFPFNASVAFRPGVVVVEREDHALHPLALQEVEVVRREAVRAVDRDRDRDADLVKRQRIEDGLGEDDLVARPRRLEVQDAAERAGKVAVPRRLHAATVEVRPLPGERIRDRHDDAAAQELAPFGRDDTERQRAARAARPPSGSPSGASRPRSRS